MTLSEILQERVLILDGAMGTMIQRYRLEESDYRGERFSSSSVALKGCNDLLVLTRPQVIGEIHEAYLEAGADIIESNSFNTTTVSLSDYHLESFAYEINVEAARLARRCADKYSALTPGKPRFVAGSMGPTNRSLSMSPKVEDPAYRALDFDALAAAYQEQASGLLEGGVDVLLVETIFDTLNAKAALYGIEKAFELAGRRLPIMVSVTLEKSGRNLSGQTIAAFLTSFAHIPLLSIGLNCSFGAKQIRPYLEELSRLAPYYVSAYPNAGMPNQMGEYDETPETMAVHIDALLKNGLVNIIGGCCGTSPAHIAEYSRLIDLYPPRRIPEIAPRTVLTGLEPLLISKETFFVNVGEQTNVAGSRKFARLIGEKKYEEALSIARTQIDNGAQILDICMDDAMLDAREEMRTFLHLLVSETDIARVPVMIDSSKYDVLIAGLKCVQGKSIVNSISLKEGEALFLEHALEIRRLGSAAVVMLFDEEGQAVDYSRKIQIAERSYRLLTAHGFPAEDIVFDLNILSIATGIPEHNAYALNFIDACRWIKAHLPGVKVSGGVSNLSFAFRGNDALRSAMHSVFLYHAIQAGMDMGIVNAGKIEPYESLEPSLREAVEDVVLNRRADATDRLLIFSDRLKNQVQETHVHTQAWRELPPQERLSHALLHGISDHLSEDLDALIASDERWAEHPVGIIEGPLMDAMGEIGVQFGAGKLFLPQIVKSARVMKKAVSLLEPLIGEKKQGSSSQGKILIATVKGDVHDIGKNIASVVMACNGYEIIDLGVMVPGVDIVEAAIAHQVEVVGLSGLITPSLDEMAQVARLMEEKGLTTPLFVSGASTSELHTSVHLNPLYRGGVYHVKDASHGTQILRLLTGRQKAVFVAETQARYAEIKSTYENKQQQKTRRSLEEARAHRLRLDWNNYQPVAPRQRGPQDLLNYPLLQLVPYIDWRYFFHSWEMKGERIGELSTEAKKLFEDAHLLLQEIVKKGQLTAHAAYGIYACQSEDERLILFDTVDGEEQCIGELAFDRNRDADLSTNYCWSDFVAPLSSGPRDYIALFACSAGFGCDDLVKQYEMAGDSYSALLVQSLADRLAEAFAEHLHERIRKEFWGFSAEEQLSIRELHEQKYAGVRVAVGYPSYPDHQQKRKLFDLLHAQEITGIQLTETAMMMPVASTCGIILAHPESRFFAV